MSILSTGALWKQSDCTCSWCLARTPVLAWTGRVVPPRHAEANYSWAEQAVQNDGRTISTSLFLFYCTTDFLLLLKCQICFLFTETLSPLTDALFSNTRTHNRFREKQCVLFFLPFVAIWHSTIRDMTRYLVSLFIVSQTPRAIPWITSMQTVISP